MEKLISQLKDDDIEILNSLPDRRQTVVWIWCQSQKAFDMIQKLNESNDLLEIFIGLTTDITKPSAVCMCRDQFKKCIGKYMQILIRKI